MTHAHASTIGSRLAQLRAQRRLTQEQLAGKAGVSVDVIRKLEQGTRRSARLETLNALAAAMDAPTPELLGQPSGLTAGADDAEVLQLRRAVLDLSPYASDDPLPNVEQLSATTDDLWRQYYTGQYAELAQILPPQTTVARAVVRDTPSGQRPAAHAVLAELLQLAATLLTHLAYEDFGHAALAAAIQAADAADDPLLVSGQQAARAWILTRQGMCGEAIGVAVAAADAIEPNVSRAPIGQIAVWGDLYRYAAIAASRSGGALADLTRPMDIAAAAMRSDRETHHRWVTFTPTVARANAVTRAVSLDRPDEALQLADQVRHPGSMPPGVHSRYLLSVAWAQTLTWRSAEALATLKQAQQLAPEAFGYQMLARSVVEELLPRRATTRLPGLVLLAQQLGVTTV